jgi:hypothetical protein
MGLAFMGLAVFRVGLALYTTRRMGPTRHELPNFRKKHKLSKLSKDFVGNFPKIPKEPKLYKIRQTIQTRSYGTHFFGICCRVFVPRLYIRSIESELAKVIDRRQLALDHLPTSPWTIPGHGTP